MNYEIIDKIPISGELDEKHFGKTCVRPLWIKFCPTDSDNWLGSFASGSVGIINRKVVELSNTSQIGILTNGAFYIIDIKSKTSIFHSDADYFNDFQITPDNNFIILASYFGIFIYKEYKLIKEIRPDFIDGIRCREIRNDVLTGEIYESGNDWSGFEFKIKTLRLKWGKLEY